MPRTGRAKDTLGPWRLQNGVQERERAQSSMKITTPTETAVWNGSLHNTRNSVHNTALYHSAFPKTPLADQSQGCLIVHASSNRRWSTLSPDLQHVWSSTDTCWSESGHPGLAWQTFPLPWPLASRALGGGCSCVAIKHAVSIQSAPLTMCQQHGSIEPPRPRPSPSHRGPGSPKMRRVCVGMERKRYC
ncbi:unnamed protein product [Boreogadus saida]